MFKYKADLVKAICSSHELPLEQHQCLDQNTIDQLVTETAVLQMYFEMSAVPCLLMSPGGPMTR